MPTNLLLINAEYPKSYYDYLSLSTGLGYISESLIRAGIKHEIYEPAIAGGYRKLKKKISCLKPDLIGYSMMSFCYLHNYEILSKIKRDFPSITIVVGGPHVSTFGKEVLTDCPAIDIAVIMEGEDSLVKICNTVPLKDIPGIIYRDKNANIRETQPPDLIQDLDSLPFPKYKNFFLDGYPKIIPLVTSRGCPSQCIFCPIASVMGAQFRARSANNVAEEIEYWYHCGYRDFSVTDDIFNLVEKRVYEICDEIEKRNLSGIRIRCSNGIRADRVNNNLLKRMKEAGFYCLAFGVESASNKVLQTIKKGETIERIEQSIKDALRLGFWVELFFLIGSPGETWQDIEESIKFALKYPVYDARFYNLIPFPHTKLYAWIEQNNYFLLTPKIYLNNKMHHVNIPLFTTPELTLRQRKKAFAYAHKAVKKHVAKQKQKLEKWLIKNKLRDYYHLEGKKAELISWLYAQQWLRKIIKSLFSLFKNSTLR